MNDEQYACLRNSRRPWHVPGLGESHPVMRSRRHGARRRRSPLDVVIARAARQLRQREAAAVAWQRVAQPEWLEHTRVAAVDDHREGGSTVVITASSSAVYYELCRQRAALKRQLTELAPGVGNVSFIIAAEAPGAD